MTATSVVQPNGSTIALREAAVDHDHERVTVLLDLPDGETEEITIDMKRLRMPFHDWNTIRFLAGGRPVDAGILRGEIVSFALREWWRVAGPPSPNP